MFGIATNVKNQQVSTCTPQALDKALRSHVVSKACGAIADALEACRRGEITREEFETLKSQQKKLLPVLTPHATFRHGRRVSRDAVPSGLSMYDMDHISNPRGRWQEIAPRARQLGICLAHITPSTEGLRLLFAVPQGMTLVEAQRWMSQQLGDADYDAVCKDLARCSFLVPEDYVLYRHDALLFAEHPCGVQGAHAEPDAATTPDAAAGSGPRAAADEGRPSDYKGVPYAVIVEKLEEQLGGKPEQGARNSFLFAMACSLRYICNNEERWLQSVLPRYGLPQEEWRATIHSATTRPLTRSMEGTLARALKLCGIATRGLAFNAYGNEAEAAAGHTPNSDVEGDAVPCCPPPMPTELPPLIKLLTSRTPEEYKAAVAHAVFPSLATHLYKTKFRYIDNVEHEATLMCLLMAGTGAGKSCVDEPINRIMADIRRRDAENLRREKEWKEEVNRKGANKDKRERPKGLVIQEVDTDITNPAFIMRTAEAEEHFLYAKLNEVEQFDALRGNGRGGQQFQLMCLAFDPNNRYGQTRVGTQSVTEKVTVRFNWNASTTIVKGQSYFRPVLLNGPISRINFCTLPEREIGAEIPVYGTYDKEFDRQLKPYIDRLCEARGVVACPEAEALAEQLRRESSDYAVLTQSRTYENLSFRANVIAYLKAMVLYVAHGRWDPTFADFIRWSKEYDLYCKMAFWSSAIEEAQQAANATRRRGPQNLLTYLPPVFDRHELDRLLRKEGKRSTAASILATWMHRGYITPTDDEPPRYRQLDRKQSHT